MPAPICTPSRRASTRAEQLAELAQRYLPLLRRRRKKPDPYREVLIERTRRRLERIHQVGQRYLPEAPSPSTTCQVVQIRRRRKDGQGT